MHVKKCVCLEGFALNRSFWSSKIDFVVSKKERCFFWRILPSIRAFGLDGQTALDMSWTALDMSKFMFFCQISHNSNLEMTFRYNLHMILHGSAWRNRKNSPKSPQTYIIILSLPLTQNTQQLANRILAYFQDGKTFFGMIRLFGMLRPFWVMLTLLSEC